jgi:hypothetical protein
MLMPKTTFLKEKDKLGDKKDFFFIEIQMPSNK